MIELLYKVVFEGDLLPGYEQSKVQKKIQHLFAIDAERAARFFSGNPRTIKSKLDIKGAKKYIIALANLGAIGYIVQEVVETSIPVKELAKIEDPTITPKGTFDVDAVHAHFERLEQKKAEMNKVVHHEIIGFDALDELVDDKNEEAVDRTDIQVVMNAEQIKRMMENK